MHLRLFTFFAILFLALYAHSSAYAQTVTVTQPLYFGDAVVTDNNRRHSINVNSNGTFLADPVFVFLSLPTEGVYQISGLDPNRRIRRINVIVDQQLLGPGEDFSFDNFDIDAPDSTDSNGEILVRLGARLQTTGRGQPYLENGLFESRFRFDIIYRNGNGNGNGNNNGNGNGNR